jgi:hypothetical protein
LVTCGPTSNTPPARDDAAEFHPSVSDKMREDEPLGSLVKFQRATIKAALAKLLRALT